MMMVVDKGAWNQESSCPDFLVFNGKFFSAADTWCDLACELLQPGRLDRRGKVERVIRVTTFCAYLLFWSKSEELKNPHGGSSEWMGSKEVSKVVKYDLYAQIIDPA